MQSSRLLLTLLGILLAATTWAQPIPWSERMANSIMTTRLDSAEIKAGKLTQWGYEEGVILYALSRMAERSGDGKYFHYMQRNIDSYLNDQGEIRGYRFEDYNLDNIPSGRLLLKLYLDTGQVNYWKAAKYVHSQLESQTSDGRSLLP